MISMRIKKFYKKTGRRLHFDAKELVGFNKSKLECYNYHKKGHFAKEYRSKGNQESRRRDAWNSGYKAKDNGTRPGKQEETKSFGKLLMVDGCGTGPIIRSMSRHHDFMAYSSSGSDTEREQLSDAVIEIKAYTQSLKKVEAQLVAHQQNQHWFSDTEDSPVNNRYAEGMHTVPLPMLGSSSDFTSYESNSSEETHESMPETVVNEPTVESQPKVWTDAPIIEEYELDNDDEHSLSLSEIVIFMRNGWPIRRKWETAIKPSAGCNWRPKRHGLSTRSLKNKGIVDSECSRCDNGTEFKIGTSLNLWSKGIKGNKLMPELPLKKPHLELLGEGKNRTLIEAAKTMLVDSFLPNTFWAEAFSTACYVLNRSTKNTELKTSEKSGDQEDQAFLDELKRLKRATGASSTNTVNTASTLVSTASPSGGLSFTHLTNTDQDDSEIHDLEDMADFTNLETIMNVSPIPTSRINFIHPSTQILGDPKSEVQTRSKVNKSSGAHAFKIYEALEDESWVDAMQEELLQFKIQKVWILVDFPHGKKAIGTKWVSVLAQGFRVSSFDLEAYSDNDYAGANLDRKSTTGSCQFLGRRLISWQCKKQTIVATSTIEA
ncbi:hypothetical protein Tco_1315310 [Tanacetum coccineum]